MHTNCIMSAMDLVIAAKAKVDKFFSTYPQRSYPKGQIRVFADESPDHIYYLISGRVRKYDVSYRGDEVIVNIFKPPAFFPMSWAINRTKNKYFYKTEEPTELRVVPADDTLQFLKANPDVTLDLLSRVYQGLEGVLGKVVHLMSGTAKSRLVYELIIECQRFGLEQEDGSCLLTANEGDMAARSGLSRETVSREMHDVKARGLITIEHNTIVIKDLTALKALHGD